MSRVLKQLFKEELDEAERSRANLRLVPPPPPPAVPPIRMKKVPRIEVKEKVPPTSQRFYLITSLLCVALVSVLMFRYVRQVRINREIAEQVQRAQVLREAQEKAAEAASAVIPKAPPVSPDLSLNHEAVQLFQKQKYREALILFKELSGKKSRNPAILINLGMVQLKLAQKEEAKNSFLEAIKILSVHQNPEENSLVAVAYNNMGSLSMEEKNWDEAAAYLKKAIFISPDLLESQLNLAKIYEKTGRPLDAVREYEDYLVNPLASTAIKSMVQRRLVKLNSFAEYFEGDENSGEIEDFDDD